MATCNEYVIDRASTVQDANVNTQKQDDRFLALWEDETKLTKWLTEFQIGETVFEIVSIEMETKEIKEQDIP
jgi:hypothetical protein